MSKISSRMWSVAVGLTLVGIVGCDDPPKPDATKGTTTAAASNKPASTAASTAEPAASATASAAANSGEAAPGDVKAPATTLADLAGEYTIGDATKPDGSAYEGTVTLAKTGDVYGFDWKIANNPPYKGVGIPFEGMVGVGYGIGDTYGVSVYKVSGGELKGTWASAGSKGKLGMEELKGPENLDGEFEITKSADPEGKEYKGKVTIKPSGEAYTFEWKLDEESYSGAKDYAGTAIKEGDWLVVGWGDADKGAGAAVYKFDNDKLTGTWAGHKDQKLGKETLSQGDEAGDDAAASDDDLMNEMMGE